MLCCTIYCWLYNKYSIGKSLLVYKEKGLQWDILNNKHDSILGQVPEDEAMDAAEILKELLSFDLHSPRGELFKMGAEVSIGKNWGKYNSVSNPDGLKEI